MSVAKSTFERPLSTGASRRQKKGACCRQDEARQRHQDHGHRRRFWLFVAAHIESASPHEVKLVEETIDSSFTQYAPKKLIGDKAYDSDGLYQQLLEERLFAWRQNFRRIVV